MFAPELNVPFYGNVPLNNFEKEKRLEIFYFKALMKMVRDTGFEPVTPCV